MYTAAKTALLGLLPGLHTSLHIKNIRTGVVCPWFSGKSLPVRLFDCRADSLADTGIMTDAGRAFLHGLPLAPVPRVAGAIFRAASDTEELSDGCVWTVPDDGEVCRIPRERMQLVGGVYSALNERLARAGPRKKWSDTSSAPKDAPAVISMKGPGGVVGASPVTVAN